jgi:glycine cleavage system H protein
MSIIPEDLKYSPTHMWLRVDGTQATLGITHYGQALLSQIVFVEFPKVGSTFARDSLLGSIESTKAGSDLYIPVAGRIIAINEVVIATPEIVNTEPYGRGWLVKIILTDPVDITRLMNTEQYAVAIDEGNE